MAYPQTLPQTHKIVTGHQPVTSNGGVICLWMSMKWIHKLWIHIQIHNAGLTHGTLLTVNQATNVAGAGSKPITRVVPIWYNTHTIASDVLVRQPDAVNFQIDADNDPKLVIFEIDPCGLDLASGFDCVGLTIENTKHASNLVSVLYVGASRAKQELIPSAVVN